MIKKFAELVKRSATPGEDLDNLSFLIRCILLLMMPYTIVLGVILLCMGSTEFAAGSFVSCGVFFLLFFLSFKKDADILAIAMALFLDIFSVSYAIVFGAASSFQQLLYVSLFVFWYDISRGLARKIFLTMLSGAAICLIRMVESAETHSLFRYSAPYAVLTYTNNIFSVLILSMIAWFYCTQFAEAERKLFLSNRELRKISHTDPLTKLMNRRFAEEEFKELEKNYALRGELISVAIGDIDFFKKVNDTYGHDAGDYVLAAMAAVFEKFMQEHGFVVRWGGEEFLFVFEHSNGDEAYLALEGLRKRIEKAELRFKDTQINVTMTFGVEEYGPLNGMLSAIEAADKKLYRGKEEGRNRVIY